ncbi:hypothetical protein GCM10018781_59970 [Kitasatospora indigofera]|uniref:Histone n=1 Tax=Kitasatospora indigofera TaxID=67307 RepID=A0A919G8Z1_9ACTN|nr:hypothetical protein [Kitasatospora indigofera]GHH80225.1 hypothetical protein GCM10018781_59970 [Kitasatospora indigofera]
MLRDTVRGFVTVASGLAEEAGKRVVLTAAELLERSGIDLAEVERKARAAGQFPPSVKSLQTLAEEAVTAGRAGFDLATGVARNEVEKAFEKVGDQVTKVGVVLAYLESRLRDVEEDTAPEAARPADKNGAAAARADGLFGHGWEHGGESQDTGGRTGEPIVAERVPVDDGGSPEPGAEAPAREAWAAEEPDAGAPRPSARTAPAKRAAAGKAARKTAGKPAGKAGTGTPAEQAPAKPASAKQAPAKQAPAKQAPAKQTPARRTPAKGAPGKGAAAAGGSAPDKAAADKAAAKKAAAKKPAAKKAAGKKTTVTRTASAGQPTAKKAAPAGGAAKRAATKRTTVRRTTSSKGPDA